MCAKCQAVQLRADLSYTAPIQEPCKYTLDQLNVLLLKVSGLDKVFVKSAININNSSSCNKYNNKIDEIILRNP